MAIVCLNVKVLCDCFRPVMRSILHTALLLGPSPGLLAGEQQGLTSEQQVTIINTLLLGVVLSLLGGHMECL